VAESNGMPSGVTQNMISLDQELVQGERCALLLIIAGIWAREDENGNAVFILDHCAHMN